MPELRKSTTVQWIASFLAIGIGTLFSVGAMTGEYELVGKVMATLAMVLMFTLLVRAVFKFKTKHLR